MKKFLFFLMLALPAIAIAQIPQPFTINGKIGNYNSKIYLGYQLGSNKVIDSAIMSNGNFQFKGDLIYPATAILIIDYKNVGVAKLNVQRDDNLIFYIEKGQINITSPDSAFRAQITGSPINELNKQLVAINNGINDRMNKIMSDEINSKVEKTQAERQKELSAKVKALQAERKDALKKFIVANPNSYLSLVTLETVSGPNPDPSEIEPLFETLSPDIKNSEMGRVIKSTLESLKTTAIGAMAPDFSQADTLGRPVKLSSFRGKYVLVDFWASWCGPCRQENPNLVATFNKYKDKNFTVLGVSLDRQDGRYAWLNAIKQDKLNWTQVSDLRYWSNSVAILYFVQAIPANYLIDPNGKIIAKDLRGEDLDAKLAEIFNKKS